MNFVGKIGSSILLKFAISILGLLVISLFVFLWHIHNTEYEMLNSIYHVRKQHLDIDMDRNIKSATKNRLELIKLRIERRKGELAEVLFTVDEKKCRDIISDFAIFPSVKGGELYDFMVHKPLISAVKNRDGELVFTDIPSRIERLPSLQVELFRGEVTSPIGYLKVFYDTALFTENMRKLGSEAVAVLDQEFALAIQTLNNNFKEQIFGLILIFAVLYATIYLLFSRLINEPIKKLEHNLMCFFNFLTNKDDKIDLSEINSRDEFGRMGKFINNGIEVSIKIHQELERHAREVSRLATVIEQSAQAIVITNLEGNIEYVNKAFESTTGYTFAEIKEKNSRILKSGQHSHTFYKKLWQVISAGQSWQGVFANRKKDGTIYYERSIIFPVQNQGGEIINYVAAKLDITKERMLEHQLMQIQKMESIGTLAGGIAHDFNNLLTVINGFVELTLMRMGPEDPSRKNIISVLEASKRAQILTSQLLAFSRKQVYQPEIVEINEVISSIGKMIRRLIGEDIHIETHLAENLPRVKADVSQMEQIFLNLAVNARDALNVVEKPDFQKKITIETGATVLNSEYVSKHPGSNKGLYAYFAVSDNGIGMDDEIRRKIFEPFFTTKEKHKGTGLGLSMVYGIVKQNNGFIYVYSEPDNGTMFKIYWPVSEEKQEVAKGHSSQGEVLEGTESILIVEDEEEVCRFARTALESLRYKVYSANNGREALDLLKQGLKVDLIVTDLIIPEMNGRKFVEKAKGFYPEGKVIYVSGYTDDHLTHNGMLEKGINFIPKPYSIRQLSSIVRKVLNGK